MSNTDQNRFELPELSTQSFEVLKEFANIISVAKGKRLREALYEKIVITAIGGEDKVTHSEVINLIKRKLGIKAELPLVLINSAIDRLERKKILKTGKEEDKRIIRLIESEEGLSIEESMPLEILSSSVISQVEQNLTLDEKERNIIKSGLSEFCSEILEKYGISISSRIFGISESSMKVLDESEALKALFYQLNINELFQHSFGDLHPKTLHEVSNSIRRVFEQPNEDQQKALYSLFQGYVILTLLNLNPKFFEVIDLIRKKKKLYIDTNILIPLVMEHFDGHEEISQLIELSISKADVKVFVLKATVENFKGVLSRRVRYRNLNQIRDIGWLRKLPDHISSDNIIGAYFRNLKRTQISLKDYLYFYIKNCNRLINKTKAEIDYNDYGTVGEEFKEEVYEAARDRKKWAGGIFVDNPKAAEEVEYDAYILGVVHSLRASSPQKHPNTWLLTLDKRLMLSEMSSMKKQKIDFGSNRTITPYEWTWILEPSLNQQDGTNLWNSVFSKFLGSEIFTITKPLIPPEVIDSLATQDISDITQNDPDLLISFIEDCFINNNEILPEIMNPVGETKDVLSSKIAIAVETYKGIRDLERQTISTEETITPQGFYLPRVHLITLICNAIFLPLATCLYFLPKQVGIAFYVNRLLLGLIVALGGMTLTALLSLMRKRWGKDD